VAVTGSPNDRAVTKAHDIGLRMVRDKAGEPGYEVVIGGGLGRTPMIGKVVRDFLPKTDLLAYLEAILQVYNLSGRRDNKYNARQNRLLADVDPAIVARIEADFATPLWDTRPLPETAVEPGLKSFVDTNVAEHKQPQYGIVSVSIKPIGGTPGDATSAQMRVLADLAERYSHDELRISHEQNVILPHVHRADIPAVYHALREAGLATANIGLVSDIIACPGMDYCALATARSIPIAQQISESFADLDAQRDIGPLKIKISGCINACGHHHVGHIGILGLDRAGVENYQITLGGDGTETATIGARPGPGFAYDEIVPAVERLIEAYLDIRESATETFLQTYRRVGLDPFKTALYGAEDARAA